MWAEPKRRRTASSFKRDWLDETVMAATLTSHDDRRLYFRDVFVYDENEGVTCSGVFKGRQARHLPGAPPFWWPSLEVLRA